MDIVWHKGQAPRRMELADNDDFKLRDMGDFWFEVTLNNFRVDMCVAGKITDKFPSVVDNNVELAFHFLDDNAFLHCLYTPSGLQCVHVDSGFLICSDGKDIAYKSEEGMQTFIKMLMQKLSESGVFREISEQQ